jgi:hypothetical protein
MGQGRVSIQSKLRNIWQALLVSAVLLAPVWGQIHKTIHGLQAKVSAEQSLFSEHAEGSLVCLALDHLASGDGLRAAITSVHISQPEAQFVSVQLAQRAATLTLAFSARAPPLNL